MNYPQTASELDLRFNQDKENLPKILKTLFPEARIEKENDFYVIDSFLYLTPKPFEKKSVRGNILVPAWSLSLDDGEDVQDLWHHPSLDSALIEVAKRLAEWDTARALEQIRAEMRVCNSAASSQLSTDTKENNFKIRAIFKDINGWYRVADNFDELQAFLENNPDYVLLCNRKRQISWQVIKSIKSEVLPAIVYGDTVYFMNAGCLCCLAFYNEEPVGGHPIVVDISQAEMQNIKNTLSSLATKTSFLDC